MEEPPEGRRGVGGRTKAVQLGNPALAVWLHRMGRVGTELGKRGCLLTRCDALDRCRAGRMEKRMNFPRGGWSLVGLEAGDL